MSFCFWCSLCKDKKNDSQFELNEDLTDLNDIVWKKK